MNINNLRLLIDRLEAIDEDDPTCVQFDMVQFFSLNHEFVHVSDALAMFKGHAPLCACIVGHAYLLCEDDHRISDLVTHMYSNRLLYRVSQFLGMTISEVNSMSLGRWLNDVSGTPDLEDITRQQALEYLHELLDEAELDRLTDEAKVKASEEYP